MMPPGFDEAPFDACVSAVCLSQQTGRIATVFKDQNERGLALVMACIIAWTIPPSWLDGIDAVTFIPATRASLRKRGFDHAELLASELAKQLDLPIASLFARPESSDQRTLSREERFNNMRGRFAIIATERLPRSPLLVDDIFTTGATLFAACDALRARGTAHVHCATFARA